MPPWYNPIVRSFGQYRAALSAAAALPRKAVTASARLEEIVPRACRRATWASLRARGLRAPALELSGAAGTGWALAVAAVLGGVWAWSGRWWSPAVVLPPVWYAAFRLSRPWAVHVPPWVRTVGELAVYGTRFGDHAGSGYRWADGDVSLKVRLIAAGAMGLPIEGVRPETTFAEPEAG